MSSTRRKIGIVIAIIAITLAASHLMLPKAVVDTVSAPTSISQGQTFSVDVTVSNTGGVSMTVAPSAADLTFFIGPTDVGAEYTVTAPAGVTIAGGASATLTHSIIVSGTATTGSLVIDTAANEPTATDDNFGSDVSDADGATTTASVTVQTPAQRAADIAPDELLGMEGVVVLEGQDAIEDVRQKHIGAVENVEDVAIVQYGPAYHQIVLWVTPYSNDAVAASENEKMADAMVRFGGNWKENLEEVSIGGKNVYRATPNGDFHYFWVEREYVFYVTIPHTFQGRAHEIITAIKA